METDIKRSDHIAIHTIPWIITTNRDITERLEGEDRQSIINRMFIYKFKRLLTAADIEPYIDATAVQRCILLHEEELRGLVSRIKVHGLAQHHGSGHTSSDTGEKDEIGRRETSL